MYFALISYSLAGETVEQVAVTESSSCVKLISSVLKRTFEPRYDAAFTRIGSMHVLRDVADRRRRAQVVLGLEVRVGVPGAQATDLLARQAGRPHVLAHEVLRRRGLDRLVLEAEVAKDLHGTLVGDVRARSVGHCRRACSP